MKILMIGPMPPPLGGTTVSFSTLINELEIVKNKNDEIRVINTNISNLKILYLIYLIFLGIKNCDVVSLHVGNKGSLVLSPIVFLISRLFNKKVVLRKFGGVYDLFYEKQNWLFKKLLDITFFKFDIILFQTKKLVDYFKQKNENTIWFPTSRNIPNANFNLSVSNEILKIIFIGHIRKEKGIFEIIEVSKQLKNVIIDVYGPFYDELDESIFDNTNINYKGILNSSEVIETMSLYDILLFPTYYNGEGYPGVIIEAKIAGLAIITTRWLSIPELIEDGKNGFLVETQNSTQIIDKVNLLDIDRNLLYKIKRISYSSSKNHNINVWAKEFHKLCKGLE